MGASVEVVVAELHSASARLETSAQELRDGLASVDDETTQLLGADWKGGAASAYAPAWQQWYEGATKVVDGLQQMSELLDAAGTAYTTTDESAAQSVATAMQPTGESSGTSGTPSGRSASTSGSTGSSPNTGSSSSTGDSSSVGESLGQAMSAASQLGQSAVQPLSTIGQAIAGLVQTAAQLSTALAQQEGGSEAGSETPVEDDRASGEDGSEERPDDTDDTVSAGAEPSGEQATGAAPADAVSAVRAEEMRGVERPGGQAP